MAELGLDSFHGFEHALCLVGSPLGGTESRIEAKLLQYESGDHVHRIAHLCEVGGGEAL